MATSWTIAALFAAAAAGAPPPPAGGDDGKVAKAGTVTGAETGKAAKAKAKAKGGSAIPDVKSLKDCKDSLDIAIFQSPRWPSRNKPLRILIASETPLPDARLAVLTPAGDVVEVPMKRYGGGEWPQRSTHAMRFAFGFSPSPFTSATPGCCPPPQSKCANQAWLDRTRRRH